MKYTGLAIILFALMVVLAGYVGGAGTMIEAQTDGTTDTTTIASLDGGDVTRTGTVNFYASDEQNAIADFEHPNVTIKRMTPVRASGDAESEIEADTDDAEVDDEIRTETKSEAGIVNDTDAEANASVEMEIEANAMANMTNTSTSTNGPVDADADADASADADTGIKSADVNDTDAAENESRVAYEADNATVDLTKLQSENVSLVSGYGVPEGNYAKVFVCVSEANRTLKTGKRVNVKLLSSRLQLDTDSKVGNGGSVDFVFDITASEAGNNGKYIPKPAASEPGTNIPTTRVGAEKTTDAEAAAEAKTGANAEVEAVENETDDNGECIESDAEGDLSVSFDGNVSVGENVAVVVTRNGAPVGNATVTINGGAVGMTDTDDELGVAIPDKRDVTIVAVDGKSEAETEFEFEVVGSTSDNPDEGGESITLAA